MPATIPPTPSSSDSATSNHAVAVYGASGHTGRFVVSELRRRGLTPILVGRDAAKLDTLANANAGLEVRIAEVDDPASLDRALVSGLPHGRDRTKGR